MGSGHESDRGRNGQESGADGATASRGHDLCLSVEEVASAVLTSLLETGRYKSETAAFRADDLERSARFLRNGCGITDPADITNEHVLARMEARSSKGRRPTELTERSRLFAFRTMSQEAIRLGLMDHDPTLGIPVPERGVLLTRPLTDEEHERGQSRAVPSPVDHRRSITWALSEATARTSEMGRVRVRDVEVELARVWLPGSPTVDARWGQLTDWGLIQVKRRLRSVSDPDASLIVWRTTPRTLRAACAQAVKETLRAAGLTAPGIRPRSIVSWAGRKALDEGTPLHEVALLLGMRSLDETVKLIGFDWRAGNGR